MKGGVSEAPDRREMRAMAPAEGLGRNAAAERITVALAAKAAGDLRLTQERSGLSKTDVVNRALSLYEFVDSRLAAGDEIMVRNRDSGDLELIRLL
jgi:hypothetical protein